MIGQDHRIDAERFRRAQNGPEIARILQIIQQDVFPLLRGKGLRLRDLPDRKDPLGMLGIGNEAGQLVGNGKALLGISQQQGGLRVAQAVLAEQQRLQPYPALGDVQAEPGALHDKAAGAFPQTAAAGQLPVLLDQRIFPRSDTIHTAAPFPIISRFL